MLVLVPDQRRGVTTSQPTSCRQLEAPLSFLASRRPIEIAPGCSYTHSRTQSYCRAARHTSPDVGLRSRQTPRLFTRSDRHMALRPISQHTQIAHVRHLSLRSLLGHRLRKNRSGSIARSLFPTIPSSFSQVKDLKCLAAACYYIAAKTTQESKVDAFFRRVAWGVYRYCSRFSPRDAFRKRYPYRRK